MRLRLGLAERAGDRVGHGSILYRSRFDPGSVKLASVANGPGGVHGGSVSKAVITNFKNSPLLGSASAAAFAARESEDDWLARRVARAPAGDIAMTIDTRHSLWNRAAHAIVTAKRSDISACSSNVAGVKLILFTEANTVPGRSAKAPASVVIDPIFDEIHVKGASLAL